MKKFGKVMLAASIAFGGVTAVQLANPVSKVEAASSFGVSVNTTKTWYNFNDDIDLVTVKMKNDNSYDMRLQFGIEHYENGEWKLVWSDTAFILSPEETDFFQLKKGTGGELPKSGSYRVKCEVYKGNDVTNYIGTFYTDTFYVNSNYNAWYDSWN